MSDVRWEVEGTAMPKAVDFIPLCYHEYVVSTASDMKMFSYGKYLMSSARMRFENNRGATVLAEFHDFQLVPHTNRTSFIAGILALSLTFDGQNHWDCHYDGEYRRYRGRNFYESSNDIPVFTFGGMADFIEKIRGLPKQMHCEKCGAYWMMKIIGYAKQARADK